MLFKRIGFNEGTFHGILRKKVAGNLELVHFVMPQTPKDYKGLNKAIGNFQIGQKALFDCVGACYVAVHGP